MLCIWVKRSEDLSTFSYLCLTDNAEIQDLRECLMIEQEEKNGLNRKVQNLEKECKLD